LLGETLVIPYDTSTYHCINRHVGYRIALPSKSHYVIFIILTFVD